MTVRSRQDAARINRYPGFGALLLVWTLFGSAAYARHLLFIERPSGNGWFEFAAWLMSFYPWVLLSPLIFSMEQRFPLRRSHAWKHFAWLSLASLPLTWLACKFALVMTIALHLVFRQPHATPAPWWTILHCEFLLQQALFWLTVGGACALRNLIEHQEIERRAAQTALEKLQLEHSLREAELETMRMRLNPHFLFNCLQNISTLARRDPDTASRMLARLGDLLRSAIGKGTEAESTLAAEIELTRAYAAIEQMRFQDQLSVLFDIELGLEQSMLPTFLLQPLVENAIKHGLRDERRKGVICIRAIRQQNQLMLIVSDNGAGFPQEKLADLEMGIGLGSVSGRLTRMYPERHSLSMQRSQEGYTEVRVVIPLRWQEDLAQEALHELIPAADSR
jgi:two-component system LytT family sensor kinase